MDEEEVEVMEALDVKTRESGDKPGPVSPRSLCPGHPSNDEKIAKAKQARGGCHSSRTGIASGLQQPTRGLRPGRPQTSSYLVLLRTGFAELAASPRQLVGSYPTVSPLPSTHFVLVLLDIDEKLTKAK